MKRKHTNTASELTELEGIGPHLQSEVRRRVARVRRRLESTRPVPRLAYTIPDALATGAFPNRSKLYKAIARGDVETWKDGRSRMIGAASLERYVKRKTEQADE